MFDLLNEMVELIYVADVNTYELLFMNTSGRKQFNIDKVDGQKCYKVLQGLDAPCSFCTNGKLSTCETYSWAFTNLVTGRHYLLKDKLIDWKGKNAKIEIAIDDTASENEKILLKNALEGEKTVMECAKQLYHTADISATINSVLEQIGLFLNASRAYIFDIRGEKMFNTYEWCAPEVQPQLQNLQDLDVSLIDSWMVSFRRFECVILESLDEMKEINMNSYQVLAQQGIHNLLVAPLEKEGDVVGYIGVDDFPNEKAVNIAPLFRTLSYFIMAAMRKAEDEDRLAQLSYYDLLTGFYNRNRYIQDISQMSDYNGSIGVVYLDINGLKDINDHYGHTRGDQVLFLCARKMVETFGSGDYYRIGGDEFLIICKSIAEHQFILLAEQIKEVFQTDSVCNAAIGYQWVAVADNVEGLISKADAMMYLDKERYYHENPSTRRYRRWESFYN